MALFFQIWSSNAGLLSRVMAGDKKKEETINNDGFLQNTSLHIKLF